MKSKLIKADGLVAYFDIYGFAELLKASAATSQMKNKPILQAFPKMQIKSLVKSLQDIWDWIVKQTAKEGSVSPYLFSDCGFIFYQVTNGNNRKILNQCIGHLELLIDKYIEKGFFIKGGVAYGTVFHNTNLLIGDAVIEAVRFETLCPGPFIIFPFETYEKLLKREDETLMDALHFSVLNLRSQIGKMESHVIFPSDRRDYFKKVQYFAYYYLRHGPPVYGKFWHDTYEYLISEFEFEEHLS